MKNYLKKNLLIFLCLSVALMTSCTKETLPEPETPVKIPEAKQSDVDKTTQKALSKWNISSISGVDYFTPSISASFNTPIQVGEYYDFRSDGKLYSKIYNPDTKEFYENISSYKVDSEKQITIDASHYIIKELSDNRFVIYLLQTPAPDRAKETTIVLTK